MTEHVKRGWQCDSNWHLRKRGALTLAIYNKIGAITYDSTLRNHGVYYSSGRKLAEFFDTSENHVTQVLRQLKADGWLKVAGEATTAIYKSKKYHYVQHDEWAQKHPGQCFARPKMVWDDEEHDELAQSLYKHSGGQTYWYPEMLTSLRSTGADDEMIIRAWLERLSTLQHRPNGNAAWKKIQLTFVHDCKVGKIFQKSNGEPVGAK
ncbi:MAG: hypothetical protein WB630_12030 [Candidatus Acidiferrales bacterium]